MRWLCRLLRRSRLRLRAANAYLDVVLRDPYPADAERAMRALRLARFELAAELYRPLV